MSYLSLILTPAMANRGVALGWLTFPEMPTERVRFTWPASLSDREKNRIRSKRWRQDHRKDYNEQHRLYMRDWRRKKESE